MQQKENVNRLYKQPDKNVGDARIVFNQFNLDKLLDAFAFILMRTKDKENPQEKKNEPKERKIVKKNATIENVVENTQK